MNKQIAVRSPDDFRQYLADQGKTLKQWAIEHGYKSDFDQNYCSRVLTGMVKAKRGKGHEIAVAMGIKANPNNA